MIVYHVTSLKKLNKYIESGMILPPVRAWEDIEQAERMSISTGRKIILRLRFPDNAEKLFKEASDDALDKYKQFKRQEEEQ